MFQNIHCVYRITYNFLYNFNGYQNYKQPQKFAYFWGPKEAEPCALAWDCTDWELLYNCCFE